MAQKLLTAAIINKLQKNPIYSNEKKGIVGDNTPVIVKFFYPYGSGTWLVTEGELQADGDWLFYGCVEIGNEWEWGYFTLSQLSKPINPRQPWKLIEREMYTKIGCTVAELKNQ